MAADRSRSLAPALLLAGAATCLSSCNAALGGGAVAILGGVGFFASQCYDRVRVRVIDPATGSATCEADVFVVEADGSERRLRPCYGAALTEGRWRVEARRTGYVTASTEIEIAEREGPCPHYTHSVELTLRREGEPVVAPIARSERADAAPAPSPTSDLESPPARLVPPPIPGVPAKPMSAAPTPASRAAPPPAAPAPSAPGAPPSTPNAAPPAPSPPPNAAPPAPSPPPAPAAPPR